MRLLFDENLSPRLASLLSSDFPGSQHVELLGLDARPDREIWELARTEGWVLVSKDDDFQQLALLFGAPPKVVRLLVGNAGTARVAEVLRAARTSLERFVDDPEDALLVLGGEGPLA